MIHVAITVAVLHLVMLSLRDHVKAFSASKVCELPFLKAALSGLALFLLDDLEELHGGCTFLDCILDGTVELGRDRNVHREWLTRVIILHRSALLSPH